MKISEFFWLAAFHRTELRSAITYKFLHEPLHDFETNPGACYSRPSFVTMVPVRKELQGDLSRAICIFYVVLRALDTVEDDMTLDIDLKEDLLLNFYKKLRQPGWNFTGSGPNEKDRVALIDFSYVIEEFMQLNEGYQKPIESVCRKMGAGMAHYARLGAARQNTLFSLETKGDLDLYCHYVAGLVGEGLSAIFSASSLESPELGKCLTLSNSMGLFLQKTNIMRDFREDVIDGRLFWPKEIWSQGGRVQDPNELLDLEKNGEIAYRALSEMVLDALAHIPDCLNYLALLKNQSVFNFCAIPQVMAIATLDLCFGNLDVFRKNVKIRRTTAAMLIIKAKNPRDVAIIFVDYMRSIHAKLKPSDPSFIKVAILLGRTEQWLENRYPSWIEPGYKLPQFREEAVGFQDVRTRTLPSRNALAEAKAKADDLKLTDDSGMQLIYILAGSAALFLLCLGVPAFAGLWYFGALDEFLGRGPAAAATTAALVKVDL